jgi:uncharacterized membrane protein (UPF0127 family)
MLNNFDFEYRGRKISLEVKICRDFLSQGLGLMFKKKSRPLLFFFKKPKKRSIHSFFCKPFVAVWFNDGKIVDVEIVRDWRFSIKPRDVFDKLLEIPQSSRYFSVFTDEEKI